MSVMPLQLTVCVLDSWLIFVTCYTHMLYLVYENDDNKKHVNLQVSDALEVFCDVIAAGARDIT